MCWDNQQESGRRFRLTVCGDLAPCGPSGRMLAAQRNTDLWGGIATEFTGSDFAIANLECPLTTVRGDSEKRGPALRVAPECAYSIRAAGLHAVSVANNHIMDMGAQGLADTLKACEQAGLATVGAGMDLNAAMRPIILERDGLRVAILAIAEREFSIAEDNQPGAAPVDPITNSEQISLARQQADVVVVLLHGGNEYYPLPRPGLVKLCRFLIRCGAAAVVCHHTHVPGPVERFEGGVICYGLGNFLFDGIVPRNEDWYVGYLIHLDLTREGVADFKIVPFRQAHNPTKLYRLKGEEERAFFERLRRLGEILGSPELLLEQWRQFCESRKSRYLIPLRAPVELRGLARLCSRFPGLLTLLVPKRARLFTLNVLRCDSHREAVETILAGMGRQQK